MMTSRLAIVAFAAVLGLACRQSEEALANGDDPLKALSASVESQKYNNVYWGRVSTNDPKLWQQALAFCNRAKGGEYPTCNTVKTVAAYQQMAAPPSQSPDQSLSVDTAASPRAKPPRK